MLAETDAGRSANVGSEEPGHSEGREAGGRTRRALLVDDHDMFRQVLAILLERHVGIDENLHANSVAEARDIMDGRDDDLLHLAVVDLDLPNGGVSELIGELHGRNIPVLAITASGNPNRSVGSSEADEGVDHEDLKRRHPRRGEEADRRVVHTYRVLFGRIYVLNGTRMSYPLAFSLT